MQAFKWDDNEKKFVGKTKTIQKQIKGMEQGGVLSYNKMAEAK